MASVLVKKTAMKAYRLFSPSSISVKNELLHFEERCKSENFPIVKSKKEQLSIGQNLEVKFHVKINRKNLVAQSYKCLWCPSEVRAARFC